MTVNTPIASNRSSSPLEFPDTSGGSDSEADSYPKSRLITKAEAARTPSFYDNREEEMDDEDDLRGDNLPDEHRDMSEDTQLDGVANGTGLKRYRTWSPTDYSEGRQRLTKAVKLFESGINGPKAGDYAADVRALTKLAIFMLRHKLSSEDPFPDPMLALAWSRSVWIDSNKELETSIDINSEITKLVCKTCY